MDYESFVAYSCIAIVVVVTVAFLHWVEKDTREHRKRREEFERKRKEIEESIRRQKSMNERNEVVEQPSHMLNDDYGSMEVGKRIAVRHKLKKTKPEWWRFLTEESIGSLLTRRSQKKAEAEARKNDPWVSR
ncbi:MAG: hypothetical protein NC210_04990 [[Clostridium] fimetarium]|nr:hypothetical protein [Alistipes timonensis]MCM1405762.1 hypothetical protein [[Clostridium] fimetarium]